MILLIDTAQETSTVALSLEGRVCFAEENIQAKDAAGWLHPAIGRLLEQAKITIRDLEAVAVVAGPGSYTGLRVGMATAKGFCYALKIPLITENTLRVMAESMKTNAGEKGAWICPMIDARRDEVFTALYQADAVSSQPPTANGQSPMANDLQEILPPLALILDKNSFEMHLTRNPVLFFGSGAGKWEEISKSPAAIFEAQKNVIQAFANMVQHDFNSGNLADPVYSEPVYLKEFFTY